MNIFHIKFVFSYLKKYIKVWFLGVAFTVISIFFKIRYSWIMKDLIDEGLIKCNQELLVRLTILFLLLVILSVFFNYMKEYIFSFISQKLVHEMRKDIINHLIHIPYKNFLKKYNNGSIINYIIHDSENIQRAFTDYIISLISSFFTILIVLLWLFYINKYLALIVLIVIPLFTFCSLILWKKIQYWGDKLRDNTSEITDFIQQMTQSLELIKLVKNKRLLVHKFNKLSEQWSVNNLKLVMNRVFMNNLWESILTPYQSVIFLIGGIWYIKFGNPSIGTMIAFIDYLNLLVPSMLILINQIPVIASGAISVEKIYDYLNEEIEISGNLTFDRDKKLNVEFKNVCFKYPNTNFSIENLSFKVDENEFVTFIGSTGSGKSTIAKLMVRLFDPDSGCIIINGHNIKDYDIDCLRDSIGIIQQDTYLLNGTIRENLILDCDNLSDYEINKSLEITELETLINRLPDKFNTYIDSKGLNLSGGERQRISIARVILKRPKLIILDEATSALDMVTEKKLLNNLEYLFKYSTCLAIDHRLTTLNLSDRVIVISDGKIIEEGTLDELTNIDGYLRKILEIKKNI